jgi:hypothetical protein
MSKTLMQQHIIEMASKKKTFLLRDKPWKFIDFFGGCLKLGVS